MNDKPRRRRLVSPPAPAGIRLIRKYGNRRLYDTRTSRYVTLGDLVEVFAGEEEVKVSDAVSGEDLTKRVLAQAILFEENRRRVQILPIDLPCRMDAFGLITRTDRQLSPAARVLLAAINRLLKELGHRPMKRAEISPLHAA